MSILAKICADKADHIKSCKQRVSFEDLHAQALAAPVPKRFASAIAHQKTHKRPAIIAEVKKASPSKGVISHDFDPVKTARAYQESGATCISVLTDAPYFQGCDDDFTAARAVIDIPMIRKDFMIDPYQIVESRAIGADCILLIMAALEDEQAKELADAARSYDMDILFETHNLPEIERCIELSPTLIGLNSRNLKTLDVDLEIFETLLAALPKDALKIAESGISDSETVHQLHTRGYDGFLIGESLMRQGAGSIEKMHKV
jgi:indole-3-glycerol phosphate synthase